MARARVKIKSGRAEVCPALVKINSGRAEACPLLIFTSDRAHLGTSTFNIHQCSGDALTFASGRAEVGLALAKINSGRDEVARAMVKIKRGRVEVGSARLPQHVHI